MRSRTVLVSTLPGLISLLFIHTGGAAYQEAGRVRIAVVDFANSSTWTWWGPQLGMAAADQLTRELVAVGEFAVVERDRLGALLGEQQLSMSGVVDPSTVVTIGEMLGVQAIVTGSVTKFSIDRTSVGIGPAAVSYAEAETVLDVRLVDTSTGEILVVVEGSGKKRLGGVAFEDISFARSFDAGVAQEALRPAVEEAVERVIEEKSKLASLAPRLVVATIVGANQEGAVYIDRGENFGVRVDQQFEVYRVVDEIRDSAGNLLDTVTEHVGLIEVTRVLSRSSVCRVVEGEAREGDEARPREPVGD